MTTNDVVARLRAMADGQHDDHSIGDEAADEIERLTAERNDALAEVKRLKDENARLTRERDETASRCEKLRELADQSAHESGVAFRRLEQAQERYIRALKGRGGRDE